jgi:hypothetical protein
VNRAIEDLVVQIAGADAWLKVKALAGIDVEVFVAMETYSDEVTYHLVGAASEVLGISPTAVLEAFGRHWILYTGRRGYGAIFETMGRNLPEFLGNLDAMHSRLSLSMPDLRPPSFTCEPLSEGLLRVEYWSEREGLAPMVGGLLAGLGELFEVTVVVTHTLARSSGADHDEFLIEHPPAGQQAGHLGGDPVRSDG